MEGRGLGAEVEGSSRTPPSPDPTAAAHLPSAHRALQGHCHPRGPALPGKSGGERWGDIPGEGAQCVFTSFPSPGQVPKLLSPGSRALERPAHSRRLVTGAELVSEQGGWGAHSQVPLRWLSRKNEFVSTYPLPNEALLPRGAQRPKVTLGEAKRKSMGVGRASPSPRLTSLSSPALIWVGSWGSPSFPRTKATL